MTENKIENNVVSGHRVIEYVPALIFCVLAWIMPTTRISACSAPDETVSAFFQNVMIALCYLTSSSPAAGIFVLLVLVTSIPISYRSWSRWSRYHLSRNHPIANTAVSLMAIFSDYAACLLLLFGAQHVGTDRYLIATLLVSLSLGLLLYSEVVSNDKFTPSQIWKNADIYSLVLIAIALWGSFAALTLAE